MKTINPSYARWQTQLSNSIVTPSSLSEYFKENASYKDIPSYIDLSDLEKITKKYPMRITPYYLSLIKSVGDPIWKQAVPDLSELSDTVNIDDPLNEEPQSPVPSIIHRYPDRVIFLVSNQCAMYCRHCMRKRKVGTEKEKIKSGSTNCEDGKDNADQHNLNNLAAQQNSHCLQEKYYQNNGDCQDDSYIGQGLEYIEKNKNIYDVILSGGDPLLLTTEKLDKILFKIRQFNHVQTIRIHTRVLCTLPFRITDNLASMLEKYHPLYVNTHFNHPSEITDEAARACETLVRAGIPLGCQTVLLKGVNDNPEVMIDLMRKLIKIRVKPYYLHHPDPVAGTAHFRSSLETGLNIMKAMRGNLTGIAIPQYMLDLPGGYGKVPVLPDYIKQIDGNRAVVENYQGRTCEYRF